MGLFSSIFGGGGSKTMNPYVGQWNDYANNMAGRIEGLWGGQGQKDIKQAFGPTNLESNVIQGFQNFDPSSYFSGAMGMLGGRGQSGGAYGAMNQGMGAMNQFDTMGGQDLLGRTIGGEFTDVANNPIYQARNAAIADQAQKFLNQNLDTVNSQQQQASGGLGAGSARTAQSSRAVQGAAESLQNTLANVSAQDLASERGLQQQAMGMGMNLPMQIAQAYSGLGSGMGNLANIFGGMGSQMGQLELGGMNQLANMATGLGGRNMQGFMMPYEMNMQLLNALKSGNVGASGSGYLSSIGNSMGDFRSGFFG